MSPTDPFESPVRPGRGLRIGARVVDLVVLAWLVAFVVVEIEDRLLGGDPLAQRPQPLDIGTTQAVVTIVALTFVYEAVPVGLWGATAAKAMFGLRVVHADDGGRPGLIRSILRWVVFYGGFFVPVVGVFLVLIVVLPALIYPDRRGLHDRIAGTLVVELPDRYASDADD